MFSLTSYTDLRSPHANRTPHSVLRSCLRKCARPFLRMLMTAICYEQARLTALEVHGLSTFSDSPSANLSLNTHHARLSRSTNLNPIFGSFGLPHYPLLDHTLTCILPSHAPRHHAPRRRRAMGPRAAMPDIPRSLYTNQVRPRDGHHASDYMELHTIHRQMGIEGRGACKGASRCRRQTTGFPGGRDFSCESSPLRFGLTLTLNSPMDQRSSRPRPRAYTSKVPWLESYQRLSETPSCIHSPHQLRLRVCLQTQAQARKKRISFLPLTQEKPSLREMNSRR